MNINIGYWMLEYGKVFCGYLFLMFLWPSVVFHRQLKGKSKTWRFGFCVTVPIVIINTVVLLLGLLHLLNQWLVCLLFYCTFVLALVKNIAAYLDSQYKSMMEAKFPDVRTLKGKYRELVLVLLFFIVCFRYVKKAVRYLSLDYFRKMKSCNWPKIRVRVKQGIWNSARRVSALFWKYGILAIVVIYGMVYFTYGAFQVYSYGYGDLYTHHGWIYGLIQGKIFPEGVYPEAMHCFIYCMHTVLGIKVYSILLFLQGIHVAVFLLSVYFLLRRVFFWRYTPLFVLMVFLTLDLSNADLIHSMFRLQVTLPQEFGLHTVCLCALYLTAYLRREHTVGAVGRKGKVRKYFWDENLFLFFVSLSAVVMIHFHTMLMVAIVCIAFVVVMLRKVVNVKYLIPISVSVLCAGVIAVAPIAGAIAEGIPFNASIDWAINAISGAESRDIREQGKNIEGTDSIDNTDIDEAVGVKDVVEDKNEDNSIQVLQRNEISITATLLRGVAEIFDKGYGALYGESRGGWMMVLTVAAAVFCWLAGRREKFARFREVCAGYPPVILASVFYILVYVAPMIGLPDLLPEGRFFAPGHMMMLAVMMMPVDVLFSGLIRLGRDLMLRLLSLLSIAGIYVGAIATGNFRGFLFYEVSRYNAAAMVTESIINTFPHYSYTIVSPTDELYPVAQYGWHEELLNFVENCSKEEYSIPSEYVFIYVEKKPLLYAQSHFFQGPWWMGEEKYLKPFWDVYSYKYPDNGASQSPDLITGMVSEAAELPAYENPWKMYLNLDSRSILESKAYDWCQRFAKEHPSVLNVFYEDDSFVCYYFRQDMGDSAYELGME